jgi:hypothetical protein
MRRLGAAALAAAAGGLLACGSMRERPRPEPPAPALQIWAPPILRWPPGAGRAVEFAIENGTQRTLEVALPDPAAAQVAIFPAVGEAQACGVAPAEPPAEPSAAGTVRLAPGDHLPVRVDLEDACASLPAGEYRYELSYRAARKGGGTLSLPTRYGTLLVAEGEAAGRRPPGPAPRRPAGRAP